MFYDAIVIYKIVLMHWEKTHNDFIC